MNKFFSIGLICITGIVNLLSAAPSKFGIVEKLDFSTPVTNTASSYVDMSYGETFNTGTASTLYSLQNQIGTKWAMEAGSRLVRNPLFPVFLPFQDLDTRSQ